MSTSADVAPSSRDTLPMSVADMTFLVRKLGNDCSPLQHIRELTQNAIEGILQLGSDAKGEVVWDVDWNHFALSEGIFKLACIDTGAGMTGPEMVEYINKLSSSVHMQSESGNFGVGAKIAAAPKNPEGLVYLSWKNGEGHMIHLRYDAEVKVYGLKKWPQNNGEYWTKVSSDLKPEAIKDHGTMVILLGKSSDDNTIEPPPNTPMRSRWILRYLNTRYFKFPENIAVKAREGSRELPRSDSRHNFLRDVHGQGPWLDGHSDSKGVVELTNARAYWWIFKVSVDKNSGHNAPGGHVAALYQNELYEMAIGRAGLARLQAFGVIFGSDRVAIYVEPIPSPEKPVTSNTARTHLLVSDEPLVWADWASEFRSKMPAELEHLQEEIGARTDEMDYKKAISERLKQIRDLLRFARFRPSKDGEHAIDTRKSDVCAANRQLHLMGTIFNSRSSQDSGNKGGNAGNIYALFAEAGIAKGNSTEFNNEPDPQWVSIEDGTRTPPDLDERAAKFLVSQNKLLINADFRVFTGMIDRWTSIYSNVPGARTTVKETVREWFTQQLIEAVMSAKALSGTGLWSMPELEKLWSEDALTAAVLPRWHIDQSIKRMLGHRLGRSEAA